MDHGYDGTRVSIGGTLVLSYEHDDLVSWIVTMYAVEETIAFSTTTYHRRFRILYNGSVRALRNEFKHIL